MNPTMIPSHSQCQFVVGGVRFINCDILYSAEYTIAISDTRAQLIWPFVFVANWKFFSLRALNQASCGSPHLSSKTSGGCGRKIKSLRSTWTTYRNSVPREEEEKGNSEQRKDEREMGKERLSHILERTKQYIVRHKPGKIPVGDTDMYQKIYYKELLPMTTGISWARPISIEEAVRKSRLDPLDINSSKAV